MTLRETAPRMSQEQFEMYAAAAALIVERRKSLQRDFDALCSRCRNNSPILDTLSDGYRYHDLQGSIEEANADMAHLAEEMYDAGFPLNVWIRWIREDRGQNNLMVQVVWHKGGYALWMVEDKPAS